MTAWQDGFRQAGSQLAPRARHFLRWWRASLLDWLPVRWQWALGWAPARLLLRQQGDTLQLDREIGSERVRVGSLPWPCEPVALTAALSPRLQQLPRSWMLDGSDVLRRRLRVPAAASGRLRDVMRFEIDRQTPFTAEQVSFDVRACGERPGGQLDTELVVLPRTRLEHWQQSAGRWAEVVNGLDVVDVEGVPLQVNLLPPELRHVGRDPRLRLEILLGMSTLVMLVLAAGQLLHNRAEAAATLRQQVEHSARNARDVSEERARLQALVDGARFLDEEHARRPSMLAVWNELSEKLPEGTWLEKIGVDNLQVQLIGLSREANQLVPLLQASTLWRRVNLTGVLQADGTAGGPDRFTLTAELQPLQAQPVTDSKETVDGPAAPTP